MGMDSLLPNQPMRPTAAALRHPAGDWRLDQLPKSRTVFLALALSAGVHALFLLAFNQPAVRLITAISHPKIDLVEWHPVDETEPPPTVTEIKDLDVTPPVNVPKLPDAPTRIDLAADFVEPLQPPAPTPDFNTDKITKIPTNTNVQTMPTDGIFTIIEVQKAPQAIAQPAPRFPHEMQSLVSEAELVVDFIVDSSGAVRNATIVSSTNAGFDRAALDGVRQCKFRPGMKDGRMVNTRIRQPIRFALEEHTGR
jgi:protein TonB